MKAIWLGASGASEICLPSAEEKDLSFLVIGNSRLIERGGVQREMKKYLSARDFKALIQNLAKQYKGLRKYKQLSNPEDSEVVILMGPEEAAKAMQKDIENHGFMCALTDMENIGFFLEEAAREISPEERESHEKNPGRQPLYATHLDA